MTRKRRLSSGLKGHFKPVPAVGTKGPLGRAPVEMPGSRREARSTNVVRPQRKAVRGGLVQNRIQWSAPKKNTTGNARDGSMYREGIDPVTGKKYTKYNAQAGGLPAEVFEVGKPKGTLGRSSLSAQLRRGRKTKR